MSSELPIVIKLKPTVPN